MDVSPNVWKWILKNTGGFANDKEIDKEIALDSEHHWMKFAHWRSKKCEFFHVDKQ